MTKLKLLAGAALLTIGGVAVAQTTPTDTSAPGGTAPDQATAPADAAMAPSTAPADPTAPAAGMPPSDQAAPATAAPMAPAPGGMAAAPGGMAADPAKMQQAQATVEAGWSKYDMGNKGSLTPLEFGNWIMAARGQDMTAQVVKSKTSKASNLPAVKVLNATAGEFAKADGDKNHMISKEELTTYLAMS